MQCARFHFIWYLQITYLQIIAVINMWIDPIKIGTNLEPKLLPWTKINIC